MSTLNHNQILKLAESADLLGADYAPDNIQGCSYDLRIGTIFMNKNHEIISIVRNNDRVVEIQPSDIVSMLSLEELNLPNDLYGTVLPMNKHSSKGLLILNPGHIDPGYCGSISICAINLSNEIIRLSLKDNIFTIVFSTVAKTKSYANSMKSDRIQYENDILKKSASKLSPSFWCLLSGKKVPEFKKQINKSVAKHLNKFVFLDAALIAILYAIYQIFQYSSSAIIIENKTQKELIDSLQKTENKKINKIDSLQIELENLKCQQSKIQITH